MSEQAELDLKEKTFRWSFSQWENYNGCPARWKFKSVLKLPSPPPGPHAARGLEMHDRVEKYIKGERPDVEPPEGITFASEDGQTVLKPAKIARKYIPIFDEFKNHPNGARHCEYRVGFDEEWHLNSASHKATSMVMVLDAVRSGGAWEGAQAGADDGVVRIAEWKSGKPKDTHADQRKAYAIAGLKVWLADRVEVTTYYLEDTAPPARLIVQASALDKLTDLWSQRRDQMKGDDICAPKPSFSCRWCEWRSSNGGPCKFG